MEYVLWHRILGPRSCWDEDFIEDICCDTPGISVSPCFDQTYTRLECCGDGQKMRILVLKRGWSLSMRMLKLAKIWVMLWRGAWNLGIQLIGMQWVSSNWLSHAWWLFRIAFTVLYSIAHTYIYIYMLHIYVYSMKKHPQIDKTFPTCQATTLFFPSANQGNVRVPKLAEASGKSGWTMFWAFQKWLHVYGMNDWMQIITVAHGLPPKEIQRTLSSI